MNKTLYTLSVATLAVTTSLFAEKDTRSLFERIDNDANGSISETEYVEFWTKMDISTDKNKDAAIAADEWPDANSKTSFEQFDKDGNGYISQEECENKRRQQFQNLDKNKDESIDKEELSNAK